MSLTSSGTEKVSKVSMKEFMVAILEDNDKSQRTVGLSDEDIMEVMEQSAEMVQLNESLGKKASFKDIVKWMIKKAMQEGEKFGAPAGEDACCGGGEMTPDGYISDYIPKLAETILEILADEPFNGNGKLQAG